MKLKILFTLLGISLLVLFSCEQSANHQTTESGAHVYIEKIRGCDYIIWNGYKNGGIVHAADCKNSLHKQNSIENDN